MCNYVHCYILYLCTICHILNVLCDDNIGVVKGKRNFFFLCFPSFFLSADKKSLRNCSRKGDDFEREKEREQHKNWMIMKFIQ